MAEENTEKVVSRRKPKDPSESKQGKNYLLVIAINEYQHCKPLRNTVKDAKDLIEILTTKYQFEKDNLFTLFDKDATRKNILKQFKELKKLVKAENKDNLIIYFSGHGEQEYDIGYWVPVEANAEEIDEYIATGEIRDWLSITPTLHTYVIVDACFSGTLFPRMKSVKPKAGYEKKASRWGLTASHTREPAHDGQTNGNSPFAKYLLQKLRDHDGPLTIQELNAFVVKEVEANTKPKQTPIGQQIAIDGHEYGQFVFHPKANEAEEWKLAVAKNTIPAFQSFQKKYPDSEQLEEADWKIALLKDTVRAFSAFRRKYDSSSHRTEALDKIEQLEEEKDWQRALRRNKISGFERYLDEHPDGKHIKEAEEKIKVLETKEEEVSSKQQEIPKPYVEPTIIKPQPQQKIDDLIFIKGGSYEMGDVLGDGIEGAPPHIVSVPDFFLAPHTVTFDEYDEYCEATNKKKPDDYGWGRVKMPVIDVSWYDALEYCNWKSKANGLPPVYTLKGLYAKVKVNWQGKGYRLPTEAEWEYAARKRGEKVRFGNGKNEAKSNEINFKKSGNQKTMPVGSYAPNALGLYDMSGNVWEWCWDVYDENYYNESRGIHYPKGPNSGDKKVLRGGSWNFRDYYCRVSYRLRFHHNNRYSYIGFRIARYSVK